MSILVYMCNYLCIYVNIALTSLMLMNEYHYNKIPGVHGSVIGELLINSLCVVDSSKVYHK